MHARLSEQFLESQAAYGTTLESQAAIRKPEKLPDESYWKDFHN
jgi:hypothetical protein